MAKRAEVETKLPDGSEVVDSTAKQINQKKVNFFDNFGDFAICQKPAALSSTNIPRSRATLQNYKINAAGLTGNQFK